MTPATCPSCGARLDGVLHATGDATIPPHPGSLAVCVHCSVSLVYTPAMTVRLLSITEFVALDNESQRNLSAATAHVNLVRLQLAHFRETGETAQTIEQLLRWALLGRKNDA